MGDIEFEITIKDQDYRKIGFWKFKKRDAFKFFKIIIQQFGLDFQVKGTKKVEEKDLDWAR